MHKVTNPATANIGTVAVRAKPMPCAPSDAAHARFASYSRTSVKERIDLLRSICNVYEKRLEIWPSPSPEEMGAPLDGLSRPLQSVIGLAHFQPRWRWRKNLNSSGARAIRHPKEPIGVCSLIRRGTGR